MRRQIKVIGDLQAQMVLLSQAVERANAAVTALGARVAKIEGKRTDQIGFQDVESTYPLGTVPDGFVLDDEERPGGGWYGDTT